MRPKVGKPDDARTPNEKGATPQKPKQEKGTSKHTKERGQSTKPLENAIPLRKRKSFTLEDITTVLCENPPEAMNVRDDQLCTAILQDVDRGMLEDMAAYFLRDEGIRDDEKRAWGPPKWNYSKGDFYDSFDFYAATGCPNCGSAYELDHSYAYRLNPAALVCLQCGHRACPMHTIEESESINDRLEAHTSHENKESSSSSSKVDELPVYIRGTRERYDFGQASKEWWQSRYLPKDIRLQDLNRTIAMISMMSKLKAPTIKELCEVCSHDEAFYTTYQARSADEGITIMYECTRCHHRKIFNN